MKGSLASIAVVLFAVSFVLGQGEKGSVRGSVSDSFGAMVPGAEVKLVRLHQGKEESIGQTITDGEGNYDFPNVPLGIYEMRVKWQGVNRKFRRRVELTSSQPVRADLVISFEPCFDDETKGKASPITDGDRAEIVRELFDQFFEKRSSTLKFILVPHNFNPAWLSASQKAQVSIMTREEVQAITEKKDSMGYYSISPLKQRGGCVEVSMWENWTVKGQLEDANMAGGGTIFEFRKVAGRWVGEALSSWIS